MGRGDKRSKKGKRTVGSYGNVRPKAKKTTKAKAKAKTTKKKQFSPYPHFKPGFDLEAQTESRFKVEDSRAESSVFF